MGAINKEQTCSHVNKGFNCKHLQKKGFFLNVPLPSGAAPKCRKGMDLATVPHTSSGKAPVQKKDFRQGAELKWKRMWKLNPSSAESSQVTRCCHRSLWELLGFTKAWKLHHGASKWLGGQKIKHKNQTWLPMLKPRQKDDLQTQTRFLRVFPHCQTDSKKENSLPWGDGC